MFKYGTEYESPPSIVLVDMETQESIGSVTVRVGDLLGSGVPRPARELGLE